MRDRLAGVLPAAIVPMDRDFGIDLLAFERYVEWLMTCGPIGLAVNVDTGENIMLSPDERAEVLAVARRAIGPATLVAGVSGPGTAAACRDAKRAADAGADALMVFPSPAFRSAPLAPELVVEYHDAIANAGRLPLIAFNLAAEFGGAPYTDDVLRTVLSHPSVIALKEASFDAMRFREIVGLVAGLGRDVVLLNGNDTFLLEATLLGADGCLLGYGAAAADLLVELASAWRDGDLERTKKAGARAQRFCDYIYARPMGDYRARSKVALVHRGVLPPELSYVRPPYLSLWATPERHVALDAVTTAGLATG